MSSRFVLHPEALQDIDDIWEDRKSTRLNSSHGYSSYAVFGLKKKSKELTDALPNVAHPRGADHACAHHDSDDGPPHPLHDLPGTPAGSGPPPLGTLAYLASDT